KIKTKKLFFLIKIIEYSLKNPPITKTIGIFVSSQGVLEKRNFSPIILEMIAQTNKHKIVIPNKR
ncbi:unnamed protein product, partial [marine sediment metagenome]